MDIYKYHSCENVFLILNYNVSFNDTLNVCKLCEDYEADGLIVFKHDPFQMYFYNKDLTAANLCGNGIRCLAQYIYDRFNIYKYIEILSGGISYTLEVENNDPFISRLYLEYPTDYYGEIISVSGKEFIVYLLSIGVKHAVVISDDFAKDINFMNALYKKLGVNINLVKIINQESFEILTYENGVGFTKSCGTGAVASAFILQEIYNFDKDIKAISAGGVLNIIFEEEIILKGESYFIERYSV